MYLVPQRIYAEKREIGDSRPYSALAIANLKTGTGDRRYEPRQTVPAAPIHPLLVAGIDTILSV